MENNQSQTKTVATLNLVAGIVGTVLLVPILGGVINQFGWLAIALLVLAVVIFVMSGKINAPKTAPILAMVAAVLNIISVFILYGAAGSAAAQGANAMTSTQAGEALGTVIGGALWAGVVGWIAWILLVVAVIFFYMTYSKLKTLATNTTNQL